MGSSPFTEAIMDWSIHELLNKFAPNLILFLNVGPVELGIVAPSRCSFAPCSLPRSLKRVMNVLALSRKRLRLIQGPRRPLVRRLDVSIDSAPPSWKQVVYFL